jgi:peptide/nickel transport system substrate-binding protein
MSYTVIFASDQTGPDDRAFQIIQADYRKIGVRLAQRTLDATAATIAMYGKDYTSYPFDVAMWAWITLIDPDYMLAVPTCAQWGVLNDSGYCNKAYDRLYAEQGVATNLAQRRAIVYKMQEMIYNARWRTPWPPLTAWSGRGRPGMWPPPITRRPGSPRPWPARGSRAW